MSDLPNVMELTAIEADEHEQKFDFSCPENILFEIVGPHDDDPANLNWRNWSFEVCTVIGGKEGVTGAASYDQEYGGFLEYTVQGLIEHPGKAGWFVVENVTGTYFKGDGWGTDDDMDFYFEGVRAATPDEIAQA